MALARACAQDSRTDLGIGAVHLPEPSVLGLASGDVPQEVLAARCRGAVATRYAGSSPSQLRAVESRLEDELEVIAGLGYPTYFLTVAAVVDLIRDMGVRVAARGSGAGSLVNYLLGISGVEPIRHGLIMERFCSPLRAQLPDIDIDVESARRTEIYERVLERFGGDRVTCVSMMDTYRVRHAIRDVAATLGPAPGGDRRDRQGVPAHPRPRRPQRDPELPELRASGLDAPRLSVLFDLVERLDGLPRHVAVHPCGVILSNRELLDRTPVEASWLGFPMSQFDKDDVETLGLLKLDILGIRMQSAMAHAVDEIQRVDGVTVDLDDQSQVTLEDDRTFRLIRTTHTLGCFQIESPGQRELVGKFAPETFEDLIIDISLFRPGPVKSDMVTPFLLARQGWREPEYLHPTLVPALGETYGVVVFHEQVLRIVTETTGVTLAQADEVRRALGSPQGQQEVEAWWRPAAAARGYAGRRPRPHLGGAQGVRLLRVLQGPRGGVRAADLPVGVAQGPPPGGVPRRGAHPRPGHVPQAADPRRRPRPGHHDPGPGRQRLRRHLPGRAPRRPRCDPRSRGRGLRRGAPRGRWRVPRGRRRVPRDGVLEPWVRRPLAHPDLPDGRDHGIRLSLADVKGISDAEVERIVAGQPYATLADFWHRAHVSRPVVERLVMAGGFDSLYGLGGAQGPAAATGLGRRGRVTRRDLLLHVVELDRWSRSVTRSGRRLAPRTSRAATASAARASSLSRSAGTGHQDVRALAAASSRGAAAVVPASEQPTQLTLDLDDTPELTAATGLPEMTGPERVRAELDILGLDASAHVIDFYAPMLVALGVTRSGQMLSQRNRADLLVAGVKVATQTPPIRSGRRVVFLTLDDSTGPVDATFFEDVQGPYAATVFHSWMLLVRGVLRRTGPRGVSLRATGAWELSGLWDAWTRGGIDAVHAALAAADERAHVLAAAGAAYTEDAGAGAARSRSSRPVMAPAAAMGLPGGSAPPATPDEDRGAQAGGMGGARRRVLVHASGFKQSPYADIKPAGGDVKDSRKLPGEGRAVPDPDRPGPPPVTAPRKLWHASPGSSGH